MAETVTADKVLRQVVDAEIPVVGQLEPDLGLSPWAGEPSSWPVTGLPADEAVYGAKQQSPAAAEQ